MVRLARLHQELGCKLDPIIIRAQAAQAVGAAAAAAPSFRTEEIMRNVSRMEAHVRRTEAGAAASRQLFETLDPLKQRERRDEVRAELEKLKADGKPMNENGHDPGAKPGSCFLHGVSVPMRKMDHSFIKRALKNMTIGKMHSLSCPQAGNDLHYTNYCSYWPSRRMYGETYTTYCRNGLRSSPSAVNDLHFPPHGE